MSCISRLKGNLNDDSVIASGVDDIWSADLADMQWSNRDYKGFKYLLNGIDVFGNYARSIPIKNKAGKSITDLLKDA